jgi:hypothetical protein
MRRALLVCASIVFAIACTDNITEPTPDRTPATGGSASRGPTVAFATTTTEDGLSISTDKDDYQPGDTVHLTGNGWPSNDVLDIQLDDEPATHPSHTWRINVGEDGTFHDSTYVVDVGDLGVTFTLTATSPATGRSLTVQFTDAAPSAVSYTLNGTTFTFPAPPPANQNAGNPITVASGALVTVNVTATTVAGTPGGANWQSTGVALRVNGGASFGAETCDNFAVVSNNTVQTTSRAFTFTAPAPSISTKYDVRVRAYIGAGCTGTSGSSPSAAEFGVLVVLPPPSNVPPPAPTGLGQFRSDGSTGIPVGGATNETTVKLGATVTDPDGDDVKLQVEVKPLTTAFAETGILESGLVTSGNAAQLSVGSLANGTSYHWRARAVDENGAASSWVSFGGNAETAADFLVDTEPPTVTINQESTQSDPTKTAPINFTVTFSEPVCDFATGDVSLSGTANAATATVTSTGTCPTIYNVAVSGMTNDGTVIASIAAGVAQDAAGNGNLASTSSDNTVIYDTTPAAISSFVINPNPVAVNTSFTISANFTDLLSNVTGAEYSLNGSWSALPAVGTYGDSKTEQGSITLNLSTPDVAEVCVRSTDAASNTNQTTGTNPIQCQFLAVYDPTAGFVTGGGWINSPAGAYIPDATLIGKATFGFVSKYLKGAITPTGNTEFQFHAGSLNFSSTSYDWLVVQGSGSMKATYKGYGTVNGAAGYGFLLSAIDGSPDKFRIKVWQTGGNVIYDNQVIGGTGENADPTTAIAGGSIVIHVPKK